MDEELKIKLLYYLDTLEKGVQSASDQAPVVAQEFIHWQIVSGSARAAVCVALFCFAIYLTKKGSLAWNNSNATGYIHSHELLAIFGPILMVLSFIFGTDAAFDATKACIAPRLVVLEKVADMVTKVKE